MPTATIYLKTDAENIDEATPRPAYRGYLATGC